jgi:CRP-like cAMP-binding protein
VCGSFRSFPFRCSDPDLLKLSDLRQYEAIKSPLPSSREFAPWLRATMTREDFDALPAGDVEAFGRFATRRTYAPGTTLFRQGKRPKEIFIIAEGEIELIHETRFDRLVVQIVHAGSSVDDLAFALRVPYAYSAVALTDVSVLCIRLDAIETLEELFPELALRRVRLMAHALERAHGRLLEFAGRSALGQVTQLLAHESTEGEKGVVDLTQKELGAMLALSRQTVSRALRELERERVLKRGRRRIRILDLARLRQHLPR